MVLRILPKNIADMIAAGEVVQRPASVVKELMENAVDAGAMDVKVIILDAGRTLIQVIDNGCGMSPDDAVLCFERHATSKLASAEDLHRIETFGFRGEALASIAAVSEVTLRTRRAEDETGVEVTMAGSEHTGTKEVQAPTGCNFAVRNLFYNIPARRKFLKSDSVELRHIVEEFQRVAITRPDIAFTLTHNGKDIHVVKPGRSLKFRIQDLLGPGVVGEIMDVHAETSIGNLSGFVGKPESAKKTLGNQFFFVNGRFFRSPYLHKAVMKAYENLIPDGVTPSYFLFLEVDPASMDVNIHPTKTEIKFEEEQMLFQTVLGAVKEVLGRSGVGGGIDFDNPEEKDMPVIGPSFREYKPQAMPSEGADFNYNPFDPMEEIPGSSPGMTVGGYASHVDKHENYGVLFQERTLPTAQILVVQGRYILTQSASGIMMVHVRRAMERLLYGRFLKALTANAHVSQTALFPEQVNVGVEGKLLFEDNASLLAGLGFDIVPLGKDTVAVNAVPEGFSAEPGKAEELVRNILSILADDHSSLPGVMEQTLAQKFAAVGAAGARKPASPIEAQRLVDALLQEENPEFTPSGKRIISIVPLEEIEKRF
ncbi:MAG: DNA mismatch repair endonuclease MutL [Bacteroidales bacterium]|nr:DNA mismatch repair endonuclease MutL [Bacteroidales bacterium]